MLARMYLIDGPSLHTMQDVSRTKRKRKVLSIEKKLEILQKLDNGVSCAMICSEYDLGKSTVSDLKRDQGKIRKFAKEAKDSGMVAERCLVRRADDDRFDKAMHLWFSQERAKGTPLSGPLVMEKARLMYEEMYPDRPEGHFKASSGWLQRFKSRHGIRALRMQGESLSGDTTAADTFSDTLKDFLEEHQLTRDQVFNADETGKNIPCNVG